MTELKARHLCYGVVWKGSVGGLRQQAEQVRSAFNDWPADGPDRRGAAARRPGASGPGAARHGRTAVAETRAGRPGQRPGQCLQTTEMQTLIPVTVLHVSEPGQARFGPSFQSCARGMPNKGKKKASSDSSGEVSLLIEGDADGFKRELEP